MAKYLPPLLLLLLLVPLATWASSSSSSSPPSMPPPPLPPPPPQASSPPPPPPVLLLDVDGTLYTPATQLEAAIAARIQSYCTATYQTTAQDADDLHKQYGSTIEGLRATRGLDEPALAAFYQHVYHNLPLDRLLPSSSFGDASGYQHTIPLRRLLQAHKGPIYIVSNSPSHHVQAVLAHLGLASFPWAGLLTPDTLPHYPTKTNPSFWSPILQAHPPSTSTLILLDDSDANLHAARALGIRGIKVNGGVGGFPLDRALAASMGAIDPSWRFDDVAYIRAKNAVDAKSFHPPTLARLEAELGALRGGKEVPLRVRDMGAGLLSMLEIVLGMAQRTGWVAVDYEAFEVNESLLVATRLRLQEKGFQPTKDGEALVRGGSKEEGLPAVRVRLRAEDFGAAAVEGEGGEGGGGGEASPPSSPKRPPAHLLVGCCLADLYQPHDFVARLFRAAASSSSSSSSFSPLVYLPITFAGQTTLSPSAPETHDGPTSLPSDTAAMAAYHTSLEATQGHNLHPPTLLACLQDHGATLLAQGPSDWHVSRGHDHYLWECLVYFFGLGLLPSLGAGGWDVPAWRRRVLDRSPDIEVGNVDLLLRLDGGRRKEEDEKEEDRAEKRKNVYVEFVGPRDVQAKEERWVGGEKPLGPTEVEIEAVCSLISSGTELKVYRGEFDRESAVDVSIKGMEEEKMDYPLRYGYSLVGRVVRCGSAVVNPEKYLQKGRLTFAFCPHATRSVVDQAATMLVPPGIAAEDAVYLPSVETALSLVQDARPLTGERVTVVGAGLIGLLIVSILAKLPLGQLRALDPLPTRRALARRVGASVALDPAVLGWKKGGEEEEETADADTSIEVSGVAAGLQTAIDHTGYGGKVVIGSWYGNHAKPAALRLGLSFHRSHLRLVVSQVSRISTELQDRWTKQRRFAVAWRLVRELRPSQTLTTRVVGVHEVGAAFHALDTQATETLAVLIDYRLLRA